MSEQGIDVGRKTIAEISTDDYDLLLESLNGELYCQASIQVHHPDQSIAPAELIELLKKHGITETVDLEQLAIFCTEAAHVKHPKDFLLASGEAAIPGADGWFELGINTASAGADLSEDDLGRVDYKTIQSFSNIEIGQQIGTIHLPQPGTAGRTITGLPIPAPLGKPVNLIAGDGVKVGERGVRLLAEKAGRAVLDGNRVSIAEEYVISGDLDLSVGHVDFNGFVDIKGDVLDDFNIRASKGINVSGSIGACRIESDGPITAASIAAHGQGLIICRGTLEARYINHANIECWGDVVVSHEIRNASVKATGMVSVEKGNIAGGETVALEGIQAKILGTAAGARTYLTSGVYFPETDRLQFLRSRLKTIVHQLKRINETLTGLNRKPLDEMRPALREAYELRIGILSQRKSNLEAEREELADELAAFKQQEQPTANAKINASGAVKEGVIISLGETTEEIKLERKGPVSLIENTEQGGLHFLSLSPLKIPATDLEEELRQPADSEEESTTENSDSVA